MGNDTPPESIRAIQTRYAGCHFRSRLEARWAVAFDALEIPWEYEPQGFELPWRLSLDEGVIRYLPDFWLPSLNQWAEVKGTWTPTECYEFLNAAAALSAPEGSCNARADTPGNDVVVLGMIPAMSHWRPWVLHMHKGDLIGSPWRGLDSGCGGDTYRRFARDDGEDARAMDGLEKTLLQGTTLRRTLGESAWIRKPNGDYRPPDNSVNERFTDALTAARSARFEHGQSGAT